MQREIYCPIHVYCLAMLLVSTGDDAILLQARILTGALLVHLRALVIGP